MSNPIPKHATVRATPQKGKTVPERLATLDKVCSAGAQCQEVTSSPLAKAALDNLQTAVTSAHGNLTTKLNLGQAFATAVRTLRGNVAQVNTALVGYEAAVRILANGDAALIAKAGLESRDTKPALEPLDEVSVLHTKPGKHSAEAILSWPAAPGATGGYAIEVNYTPQNPQGTWTALTSGTSRRRVVTAPTPGAQLLARVAALGSGGAQSAWCDAILVTTAF
jgi:hypothetical protein